MHQRPCPTMWGTFIEDSSPLKSLVDSKGDLNIETDEVGCAQQHLHLEAKALYIVKDFKTVPGHA